MNDEANGTPYTKGPMMWLNDHQKILGLIGFTQDAVAPLKEKYFWILCYFRLLLVR